MVQRRLGEEQPRGVGGETVCMQHMVELAARPLNCPEVKGDAGVSAATPRETFTPASGRTT